MREDGRAVSEKIIYTVLGVANPAGGGDAFLHVWGTAVFSADRIREESGDYCARVSGSALCADAGDAERLLDRRRHL